MLVSVTVGMRIRYVCVVITQSRLDQEAVDTLPRSPPRDGRQRKEKEQSFTVTDPGVNISQTNSWAPARGAGATLWGGVGLW